MLRIRHYLLVFRAVTATTMGVMATLATAVTGGVLRSTFQPLPGTASWATAVAVQTEAAPISAMGFLCVASGIKRYGVDHFYPEPVEG